MQPDWKGIITINQTIRDVHALSAIIDEIWTGTQLRRPILMGPASSVCVEEDAIRILRETAGVLSCFLFHSYEDGSGATMWADVANASWLREHGPLGTSKVTNGNASTCTAAVRIAATEDISPEAWLTGTNSAYNNQSNGSNAFLNLHRYAASRGQYAAAGLTVHNYFTLTQGRLAMLGCGLDVGMCAEDKLRPNPTYFLAVLHKRLVGTRVFAVSYQRRERQPADVCTLRAWRWHRADGCEPGAVEQHAERGARAIRAVLADSAGGRCQQQLRSIERARAGFDSGFDTVDAHAAANGSGCSPLDWRRAGACQLGSICCVCPSKSESMHTVTAATRRLWAGLETARYELKNLSYNLKVQYRVLQLQLNSR